MKMIEELRVFRRSFLRLLGAGLAGLSRGANEELPPVRAITRGPKFHWFGYYDKLQFDPTSRYVLGMEVGFEHRTPRANDIIKLGMIDLADGDRWIELGESRAWCWQQGCMLQWIPGSTSEVIWNDREGDRFVARILDVKTRKQRTLPGPIYTLSPDGHWAVTPNFARLQDCRPGYGYVGAVDANKDIRAPENDGIWRMNLRTGKRELIIPYATALRIPYEAGGLDEAKHWYNHLLFAPDGKRFIFLHRWRGPKQGRSFETRMFTANLEGQELFVLDPYGKTSHFIWRDARNVLAWSWHPSRGDRFYLYEDRTGKVEVVGEGVMTVNGHCSYLPNKEWILNDTYPDKNRNQNPYLYNTKTNKRYWLGHFRSPEEYSGEWRCDTHPRFSPDGKMVTIDSPHAGAGRQIYLIDIREIAG
jgi:hypothetical protein